MVGPNKKKRLVNEALSKVDAIIEQMREEAAKTCASIADRIEESHKQEAIILHNRFAAIIGEMKPASENVLLVLELLKHEVVNNVVERMSEAPRTNVNLGRQEKN